MPTCFARLLLQGATAELDWLALVGAQSMRGGALAHLLTAAASVLVQASGLLANNRYGYAGGKSADISLSLLTTAQT